MCISYRYSRCESRINKRSNFEDKPKSRKRFSWIGIAKSEKYTNKKRKYDYFGFLWKR